MIGESEQNMLAHEQVGRNMKKLEISIVKKLIKLRNQLDAMSQLSWSFSLLNKQHPIASLTEDEAKELITAYEELWVELQEMVGTKDGKGTREDRADNSR